MTKDEWAKCTSRFSSWLLDRSSLLPWPSATFPPASIEHARDTVTRCVERAEGPAVILGPAGTGKSTLCHVIAQQMRERFRVAMLASARLCTRRALLQNILFELKLPYRDRDEGELRLSLIDALEPSDDCPHGMVLIVDEAHMLPLRLLEEIRMITNLVRQGQPRCAWYWPPAWCSMSGWRRRVWSPSISASRRGAICSR